MTSILDRIRAASAGRSRSSMPPVVSGVAQAYQNDPRTKMAVDAMKAGTSTAPVAGGKYAYADGIARVLQGAIGAYATNRQNSRYTHGDYKGPDVSTLTPGSKEWYDAQNARGQDGVLAERQFMGQDGLTGTPGAAPPPVAPPPGPSMDPSMAGAPAPADLSSLAGAPLGGLPSQIATAVGAPAPTAPSAPALPVPPTAPQPPGLPVAPTPDAGTGGGPSGTGPFVSGVAAPSPAPPVSTPLKLAPGQQAHVAVSDLPAPVARPDMPTAMGPTRSKLLDAAYKIMAGGNAYESDRGQDMYGSGLSEQDKLDEAATARQFELQKMGYQTDLGVYGDAASADRGARIHDHEAGVQQNYNVDNANADHAYGADQGAKNRANEVTIQGMRDRSAIAVEKLRAANIDNALTPEESTAISAAIGDHRLDPMRVNSRNQKALGRALVANPGLDAIHLHGIAQLDASPAAQQKAMLLEALPTVLGNVRDAGSKLNYSNVQFMGKLQAMAKGQLNDPDFVAYMGLRNDALQTLSTVMRNTGATDLSTKLEAEAARPTMSPRAQDAWLNAQLTAVRPRLEAAEKRGLVAPGTTAAVFASTTAKPSSQPASAAASDSGWGKATVVN